LQDGGRTSGYVLISEDGHRRLTKTGHELEKKKPRPRKKGSGGGKNNSATRERDHPKGRAKNQLPSTGSAQPPPTQSSVKERTGTSRAKNRKLAAEVGKG